MLVSNLIAGTPLITAKATPAREHRFRHERQNAISVFIVILLSCQWPLAFEPSLLATQELQSNDPRDETI